MTLIIAVNGRESIWMLGDRRLSYADRPPRDDARKLMCLETTDGVAILGYAGLGATARGTEPSDWMSAVVRGRNLPLEQVLRHIVAAMHREFPKHLRLLPRDLVAAHHIVVPAYVNGEVRLYSINLVLAQDRKSTGFRYTRYLINPNAPGTQRPPRLGIAGSGANYLLGNRNWIRGLLRLVRASDRNRASPLAVADHLASVNLLSSQHTTDRSVGRKYIVAWRHNKTGIHMGGGGQQSYDGTLRTTEWEVLPEIAGGIDVRAMAGAIIPHIMRQVPDLRAGKPLDTAQMDEDVAKLPKRPDEKLP
jgi:hypothetical protein